MSLHKVVLIAPSAAMITAGGIAVGAQTGSNDLKATDAWNVMLPVSPLTAHNEVVDLLVLIPALVARIRQDGFLKVLDLITDMKTIRTKHSPVINRLNTI